MNALTPQFQAGQSHFGGYQLLRHLGTDAAGMMTWLSQRGAETFLLHVLPVARTLSDRERAPLIRLINHGRQYGRGACQMKLHDVSMEDGQPPVTALVEAFPPLPDGAVEWLPLMEWTQLYGPATAAQITPHLPGITRSLDKMPAGRHGRLSPGQCWIAGTEGSLCGVALAGAGMVDFHKQVPEMRSMSSACDDVQGLGHVLYHWLTGRTPPPSNHRQVLKDLSAAHSGEDRTPDHWQRLIACNVDADPTYRSPGVEEMVSALLHPVSAPAIDEPPLRGTPSAPHDLLLKIASVIVVVVLGFVLLGWLNHRTLHSEVKSMLPQFPAQHRPPEFVPLAPPVVVKPSPPPSLPPPEPERKPALLPVPSVPRPADVVLARPEARTEPPATPIHREKNMAVHSGKQTGASESAPVVRIPFRPASPPPKIERDAPPVARREIVTHEVKAAPAPPPPKALPVLKAITVAEAVPDLPIPIDETPVIVQATPVMEAPVQALPLEEFSLPEPPPDLVPLPPSYNLDFPPPVFAPEPPVFAQPPPHEPEPWEWVRPIRDWRPWRPLIPTPSLQRGPDKPLWVRPSQP